MTDPVVQLWVPPAGSAAIEPLRRVSLDDPATTRPSAAAVLHVVGIESDIEALIAGATPPPESLASFVISDGQVELRGIPPFGDVPFAHSHRLQVMRGADIDVVGGPPGCRWRLSVRDGRWCEDADTQVPRVDLSCSWGDWIRLLAGRVRVRELVMRGECGAGFAGLSILASVLEEDCWAAAMNPYQVSLDLVARFVDGCHAKA